VRGNEYPALVLTELAPVVVILAMRGEKE